MLRVPHSPYSAAAYKFRWVRPEEPCIVTDGQVRLSSGRFRLQGSIHDEVESVPRGDLYFPLQVDPPIEEQFADVSTTEDVATFSTQFGLLRRSIFQEDIQQVRATGSAPGESVQEWLQWAGEVREVLAVWRALQTMDLPRLRDRFAWKELEKAYQVSYGSGQEMQLLRHFSKSGNSAISTPWKYGDLVQPARFLLARTLTRTLRNEISYVVSGDQPKSVELHIEPVPTSLLGAIWLAVLHQTTGSRPVKFCLICGAPFVVAPREGRGRARSDQRVHSECSSRRRFRQHYAKRKEVES